MNVVHNVVGVDHRATMCVLSFTGTSGRMVSCDAACRVTATVYPMEGGASGEYTAQS